MTRNARSLALAAALALALVLCLSYTHTSIYRGREAGAPPPGGAHITRRFTVYDYKRGASLELVARIPLETYLYYKEKPRYVSSVESLEKHARELVRQSAGVLKPLSAYVLEELALGDKEVFANTILQVSRQIRYEENTYTKWPVETLAEGNGDCDDKTLLAAAMLEAAGLDAAIAIAFRDSEPHALLAVALNATPPRPGYGLWKTSWNNKTYLLADTTIGGGWEPGTTPPGFYVGEAPQNTTITTLIDT